MSSGDIMDMTQAFAYLRVSSDGQVDGDGFTRQREAIEKYAAANNINIIKYFEGKSVSGTVESIDRPAFQDMLAALVANGTKVVLIERLDRIARDIMVQEGTVRMLIEKGFQLISVSEPDLCSGDMYRSAMRQMMAVFAELDRKSIVYKLKAARQRKKAATGRCEGRKPYGHYAAEVDNLKRINELRANSKNFEEIAPE